MKKKLAAIAMATAMAASLAAFQTGRDNRSRRGE